MKYLFSLVFSFPICLSFAQTTYIDLLKKYADEKRVILNKQETYYLNIKDGLPTAYRDYLEEVLVIDPSTVNNGMAEIYFNTFSNISDIEGETQVGKEKFRINLYNDIETHDVSLSGIFYSDYKKKTIHFKRLEKGAKTRVAYKEEFIRPRMMPVFKVGDNAPILSTELRVIVSDNIHLGYKIFNNENETIEVKKIVDGVGRRVFIFQAKNVEKMLYEDSAPSYSCSAPHVIFYIKGYDTKDGYQPFLESDKDLYNWYNSLISNLNRTDETELQAITAKLIRYEETDEAKARTIFNWVQQKVKYIAFEDGMGGFIPREAADVCTKRYGDCKDMANLLNQMMTYAELDSYLVWVGTRNRPYSYKEVPTPIVDNHMIVAVKLSDEIIFLDATGQYVPFGYPTPFIQGKEAMVNLGVKHQIIKVPEMNATDNLNQNVIHINIEDDVLRCKGEKQLKGYSKMSFLHRVNDAGNDEEAFWQNYLRIGNNKFQLNNQTHKLNTYDVENAVINFDFTLENYVRKVGSRILLNPNLYKTDLDVLGADRKNDYEFRYKRMHQMQYVINIPEGYKISKLPSNSEMNNDYISYIITYQQKEDKIIVNVNITNHTLLVEKENQVAYNEIVEALKKAQKKNIMFVVSE